MAACCICIKRADGKTACITIDDSQWRDEEGQEIQEDGENYPDTEKTLEIILPGAYRHEGRIGFADEGDDVNWNACVEDFNGQREDADERICEWISEGDRLRFGDCLFIKRADGAVAEVHLPDGVEIDEHRAIDLAGSLRRYYPEAYQAWEAKTWVSDPEYCTKDEGYRMGYSRHSTFFTEDHDEGLKEWVEGGAGSS